MTTSQPPPGSRRSKPPAADRPGRLPRGRLAAGRPASGRLAADEIGDGPPLLLLHAFPLSRRMWQPQLAGLADCCRMLAPDLPGFGSSPPLSVATGAAGADVLPGATDQARSGGAATGRRGETPAAARHRGKTPAAAPAVCRMEDMARAVMELLDDRGIDAAVVCGLSMGGYVTLALCELFGERVRGLVLADTRSGADDEAGRRRRLESALAVDSRGSEALLDSVAKLLGPDTRATRPDLVAWLRREIAAAPAAGVAAAQRGMAERPDRTRLLPSLAVPALVVVGEQDELTPPPESELLRKRIPGARLVTIAGAGHLSNLEQPQAFNAALREFLKAL
jgi:pimeloyl-ACP methyl ester carboxylesterase